MIKASLFALTIFISSIAFPLFGKTERQQYIQKALQELREAPSSVLKNLEQFIRIVEQNTCRSSFEGLSSACLMEQAEKNCRSAEGRLRKSCPIISDLLVVNKLNEKQLVSKEERMKLLKSSGSYTQLVQSKYALLTTEFLLLTPRNCTGLEIECLSKDLDQYCLQHSDTKSLPWQACIGAVVWFIGNQR